MPVLLRKSDDLPGPDVWDRWICVGETTPEGNLRECRQSENIEAELEEAFNRIRPVWWQLGRTLSSQKTSELSHATCCASFGSDLGIMLAWADLLGQMVRDSRTILAVCDDPFLFRHLAGVPGISAGRPPSIAARSLHLAVRGLLAKCVVATRVALASIRLRNHRKRFRTTMPAIMVYGHPESTASGLDAYFGSLLQRLENLFRVLHTDCPYATARTLCRHERTVSLHGWGNPVFAIFALPFARWKPDLRSQEVREFRWILRRAAALENSGGGPAMNRWQIHCQTSWLARSRPSAVAWPWENFSWERQLVIRARGLQTDTIGYQHTVIGPHQFNYSVRCNPDQQSVPDVVAANGPAYRKELIEWGLAPEKVVDAGSIRIAPPETRPVLQSDAPIFVALSANTKIAAEQVAVAEQIAAKNRRVVVKQHPMYPVAFQETDWLSRTETGISDQEALSCVIYSTGASGMDALLAGIPAIRLRFENFVSIDTMPILIESPVADRYEIARLIEKASAPVDINWSDLFSPVDFTFWSRRLKTSSDSVN